MNQTKVVLKSKSEVLNFLTQQYNEGPNAFSLLLEEESQNLYFKSQFMSKNSVLSDRQVRTLKSELYRQITQDQGFRVVRDEHLGYYLFEESGKNLHQLIHKYLRIMSCFPEFFYNQEFREVLIDYLKNSEEIEFRKFYVDLEFCQKIYESCLEKRIVSASTTELLLDRIQFSTSDKIFVFERYFKNMPEHLQNKLKQTHLNLISIDSLEQWDSQISLFEQIKEKNNLKFFEFDNPVDESRYLLHEVQKNPESQIILYPTQSGYENLFNFYQRELSPFFNIEKKNKKILSFSKALNLADHHMGKANSYSFLESISEDINYSKKKKENFKKIFSESAHQSELMSYDEIINLLNTKVDLEEELDFISELQISLPQDLQLEVKEWIELLRASLPKISKSSKIESDLKIIKWDQSVNFESKRVYICGWGNHAFRPKASSVLSQKALYLLEQDLGIKTWNLTQSSARQIFQDPMFKNPDTEIVFSSPKVDLKGKVIDKGVFTQLLNLTKKENLKFVERERNDKKIELYESHFIGNEMYNVSASSLSLYDDCPFKFYTEKVLQLDSGNYEDYFLDPLKEGNLFHELLEKYIAKPISREKFLHEIESLVSSTDDELDKFRRPYIERVAERLWSILVDEKDFITRSRIQVHALEKSFQFSCHLDTKTFSKDDSSLFRLRGKVDRIDQDEEGNILVYDYKRGDSGISMLKNYKGIELKAQLFIYCLAANEGFLTEFKKLVGFQYINLSKEKRVGGFVNNKYKGNPLIKEVSTQACVDDELFKEKMNLFLEKFWEILNKIRNNQFEPQPKTFATCAKCDWKALCRKSETLL